MLRILIVLMFVPLFLSLFSSKSNTSNILGEILEAVIIYGTMILLFFVGLISMIGG